MRIDLHTHSLVSDGTDSPAELVLAAHRAGLDVIALTDHDTMAGVLEAAEVGRRVGVQVLAGVELSSNHAGREVHLLGYGLDARQPDLQAEFVRLQAARASRIPEIIAKLTELGFEITEAEVWAKAGDGNVAVGRPQIADVLVDRGYVASRDEAFATLLHRDGPAYVSRYTLPLPAAIELVHAAGGAAVLAHPGIRDAARLLGGDSIAELVSEYGLDGIEVDYPLHDAATRDLYHRIGARLDLVRTGSSDYHGLGKVGHGLGSATTRPTAYEELLRRIDGHRIANRPAR